MSSCYGIVVVLALLPVGHGYPYYFLNPSLSNLYPKPSGTPACADHPESPYARHPGPVVDSSTTFTFTDASGAVTTTFCPGGTYSIKIAFPTSRLALVTSSQAVFPASQDSCKSRVVLDPQYDSSYSKRSSYTLSFTIPCAATGSVSFKVSSASVASDSFHQSSVTNAITSSCQLAACTAPAPASPTPSNTSTPPPSSTSLPAFMDSTTATAMCAVPKPVGSSCKASSLGYTCSATVAGLELHWTLGGCPPTNPCTTTSRPFAATQFSASQQMLHLAVSAPTTGYIALGFAVAAAKMPGTDAVVGWATPAGQLFADAFHITTTSVSMGDLYPRDAHWLVLSGAVEAAGTTTVCFTRPMDAPSALAARTLSATRGIAMNYALGASGADALVKHVRAGGLSLNLRTNQAAASGGVDYKLAHGVLMALAWILLVPIGVLFARHKSLLNGKKWGSLQIWFISHRGIQLFAVALFLISFIIAMVKLSVPGSRVGDAHAVLGYLLVALAGCQVLGTLIRPAPTAENRRIWNLFHWNMGTLSLLTGITNVYIGIAVYSNGSASKLLGWLVPVSSVLVLHVVANVLLGLSSRAKAARDAGTKSEVPLGVVIAESGQ